MNKLIPRKELETLKKWDSEPEAIIILGARRVGKSTLMSQYSNWLVAEKDIKPDQILQYNLDFEADRIELESQISVSNKLNDLDDGKAYVFIDEIQRRKDSGLFLKGLIDKFPQVKFIVSGSSSLEIRSKVADVLTGRKKEIYLLPLSVEEVSSRENFLEDLLVTGGYPAVFLSKTKELKIERLEEIITSYMRKDVQDYLGVELTEKYKQIMTLLANQIGGLVSNSNYTSNLNIHLQTLERYFEILKNTFILDFVEPFSTNPSNEIVKAPIPYFLDNGLRNSLLNTFEFRDNKVLGLLFENLVYLEIKRSIPKTQIIKFWRTKDGREVDFIVTNRVARLPIEVKYQNIKDFRLTNSIQAYLNKYKPENFIIVNLDKNEDIQFGKTLVKYRTIENFQAELKI